MKTFRRKKKGFWKHKIEKSMGIGRDKFKGRIDTLQKITNQCWWFRWGL